MKISSLIKDLRNYKWNLFFIYTLRVAIVIVLLYGIYWCLSKYQTWNNIITHKIEATIRSEGLFSKQSYCSYKVRINAGNLDSTNNGLFVNTIEIHSDSQISDSIPVGWIYSNSIGRYIYRNYERIIKEKKTFYLIDYSCHTNLQSKFRNKDYTGLFDADLHTFCYNGEPVLSCDSTGTHMSGSCIFGFDSYQGSGGVSFNTNLLNAPPSITSPWDITQANYTVLFNSRIKCDTLSIEFNGATAFSAMYPIPNKMTVSSIEFTDSLKIKEIMSNGLRFHVDFVQFKELSARRNFLLTAIFSLIISLFSGIIIRIVFDTHLNK